jgi:cell division inhibitor SepF
MAFVDMVKNFIAPPYEDDDYAEDYVDEEYYDEPEPQPVKQAAQPKPKKHPNNKVVSINTNVSMQVSVSYPVSIEEAAGVCGDIRNGNTVVVNLEGLDEAIAQRISDFICGAGYVLDRDIQAISDRIIIVSSTNIKITGEFKQELAANGIKIPSAALWH